MNVYYPIASFYRQNMGVLYMFKMFKCFCRDLYSCFMNLYALETITLWFCSLLGDLIFMMAHNSDRQIFFVEK